MTSRLVCLECYEEFASETLLFGHSCHQKTNGVSISTADDQITPEDLSVRRQLPPEAIECLERAHFFLAVSAYEKYIRTVNSEGKAIKFDVNSIFVRGSHENKANESENSEDHCGGEGDDEDGAAREEEEKTASCARYDKKNQNRNELPHRKWDAPGRVIPAYRGSHECRNCGKKVIGIPAFRMHLKTCVAKLEGAQSHNGFICCHCGRNFTLSPRLGHHKKRQHPLEKCSARSCGCCLKALKGEVAFFAHIKTCTARRCLDENSSIFPRSQRNLPPDMEDSDKTASPNCSNEYWYRSTLRNQLIQIRSRSAVVNAERASRECHSCEEKPTCSGENSAVGREYQCRNCDKVLSGSSFFTQHVKSCVTKLIGAEPHNGLVCCHCGSISSRTLYHQKKGHHPLTESSARTCGSCGLTSRTEFLVHLDACEMNRSPENANTIV